MVAIKARKSVTLQGSASLEALLLCCELLPLRQEPPPQRLVPHGLPPPQPRATLPALRARTLTYPEAIAAVTPMTMVPMSVTSSAMVRWL